MNNSAKTGDRTVFNLIQSSGNWASIKPTLPSIEVAVVTVQEVQNDD